MTGAGTIEAREPALVRQLAEFRWRSRPTRRGVTGVGIGREPGEIPVFTNEFWTARQREAHSLHEISYRACFKPQLPRFFIERLTRSGDAVYDPFMGRGTTLLEAALLGRVPWGSDVNPLSAALVGPRLEPPTQEEVSRRLAVLDLRRPGPLPRRLLAFYHPETLRQLAALRRWLLEREAAGSLDGVDRWIRMVALNRLTGHSPGFFSVYTLPPNQAVSVESQRRINAARRQTPPRREVAELILRKSRALLADCDGATRRRLGRVAPRAALLTASAAHTPAIGSESVDLVVTSPPFLDVVDYAADNWLRCWFCGIDSARVPITRARSLPGWQEAMGEAFGELKRVLRPGAHVAFEVGEVRGGQVRLEEAVLPCAIRAGFEPVLVMINAQRFTKTANCWGIENGRRGTNTNRVVVLRKPKGRLPR
jgi:hypothetical protein